MAKITVNAMGQQCPIPVVQATRALEDMTEAGELTVLVDNVTATENLHRMAAGHQLTASVEKKGEGEFVVTIPVVQPLGKAAAPAGRSPSAKKALRDRFPAVPEGFLFSLLKRAYPWASSTHSTSMIWVSLNSMYWLLRM